MSRLSHYRHGCKVSSSKNDHGSPTWNRDTLAVLGRSFEELRRCDPCLPAPLSTCFESISAFCFEPSFWNSSIVPCGTLFHFETGGETPTQDSTRAPCGGNFDRGLSDHQEQNPQTDHGNEGGEAPAGLSPRISGICGHHAPAPGTGESSNGRS